MQNKILSNLELRNLEKRIDEIDKILDICNEVYDLDVIENLSYELSQIVEILENSLSEVSICS